MTGADCNALLPLLGLAITALVLALVPGQRRRLTLGLTLAGLIAAAAGIAPATRGGPRVVGPLQIDRFALFYTGLLVAAAAAVALFAHSYLARRRERPTAFYLLLLLATLGAVALVSADDFVALFLGLEILSVGLYGLIGYLSDEPRGIEASFKYLIMAAASSAFLLFGVALVYLDRGTLSYAALSPATGARLALPGLALPGLAMILVGLAFKLGVVPFHMWTPDVYEGAPAPVGALLATVSKGAALGALLRLWQAAALWQVPSLVLALSLFTGASMLVGNLLAVVQRDVKRMLAYSSIAHLGYMLVGVLSASTMGVAAVTYYLTAYTFTTVAAFGVIAHLSAGEPELEALSDYRGLAWQRPWAAAVLIASLLSLAGIPLTAGFTGKFYVVLASAAASGWALLTILVAGSAIGLIYYLRIVAWVVRPAPTVGAAALAPKRGGLASALALLIAGALVVGIGSVPAPLDRLVNRAVGASGLVVVRGRDRGRPGVTQMPRASSHLPAAATTLDPP